jgi:membrane dipeptidase
MRLFLPVFLAAIALQAQDDMARARRISAEAIGIDSHIDTIQHVLVDGVDLANRLPNGMVDFPRLREGGMKAPFFALWVPVYYQGAEAVRRTLDLRDAMQRASSMPIRTRSSSPLAPATSNASLSPRKSRPFWR